MNHTDLRVTEEHITRLDRIFEQIDKSPGRKTCDAMVGLLEEGQKLMEDEGPEPIIDAAIIAAAQKVEHYEIATYGTLRDWARQLGHSDVATTCQTTLDEEERADKLLTVLSAELNTQAARSSTPQ